ncbi:MAG TPA: BadF/BadG/BcrA/BcrD ATPase family protein [Chloroflexota bacterium]|jgi:N-acetylglucosamine kinase-like BadF-type ATPase|nr:BadF/BadG/BcrA/BcrD ATPase family protein [Chloroflexota bacterium]
MRYVIGVDGGGTFTRAVVMDEERAERGRGAGGPGNYHSAGKGATLANIQSAVDEALGAASLTRAQISHACFALGGVGRPADRDIAQSFAQAILPDAHAVVCNDGVAALYSGAGKAEGIVVVAGTGSIIYGFAPDGRKARASGWGYRLGDEGSAWWLAEQSLFAIARARDGRGAPSDMSARYLKCLNLNQPEDLIGWAYSPAWTRDSVAALAPLTLDAAQAGDPPALQIVSQGTSALAQAVEVVACKLDMQSSAYKVVLYGGLFRSAFYVSAMRRAMNERSPNANTILPTVDAATGAAWIALDALHGIEHVWID